MYWPELDCVKYIGAGYECTTMSETKSESAGVVKISKDGVIVVPVEVREVLGIKDKEAYVRVQDIEVAEIIDDGGDGSE